MYELFNNTLISMNTSDMIDQLTRIQAEYYVEKHLGTITLTRSLKKRSLFELTSKYIHWFSLNFKEEYLTKDFQSIHRTNRPKNFIYIFILLILIGSLLQSIVLNPINLYYLILYSSIIIGLVLLIILFHYSISTQNSDINKKFYVYLNILICLTVATLVFVAIQYQAIQNFKYLFIANKSINKTTITNLSSSQRIR
jgi:ABC-type Fe3+-siderophore transport system permease subunit